MSCPGCGLMYVLRKDTGQMFRGKFGFDDYAPTEDKPCRESLPGWGE